MSISKVLDSVFGIKRVDEPLWRWRLYFFLLKRYRYARTHVGL